MSIKRRLCTTGTLAGLILGVCGPLYLLPTLGYDLYTIWRDNAAAERFGRTLWISGFMSWLVIAIVLATSITGLAITYRDQRDSQNAKDDGDQDAP